MDTLLDDERFEEGRTQRMRDAEPEHEQHTTGNSGSVHMSSLALSISRGSWKSFQIHSASMISTAEMIGFIMG